MFSVLAKYYDALVANDEARDLWKEFVLTHGQPGSLLEIGSGTGELTLVLAEHYDVTASDISESMLQALKDKDHDSVIKDYQILDMSALKVHEAYDTIIAFCDTINYLDGYQSLDQTLRNFYNALKPNGVVLFDIHSLERLDEFADDYIETGSIDGVDYQWSIQSIDQQIHQHFVFYEDDAMVQDYFEQFVFDPLKVKQMLEIIGFKVNIYTDFKEPGLKSGEKIFFEGRKV